MWSEGVAVRPITSRHERLSLRLPLDWHPLLQPLQDHALVQRARQDRLDDVRREQRQPRNPADVARAELLGGRDLGERDIDAGIELSLPAPSPGQGFDQGAVGLHTARRGQVAAIGGEDALAAALSLEAHGDADDEGGC
jgi:hypothetical protein